jgi:uncharacterized membrane protein YdjX (TVP38/TMEM64 family)
MRLATLFIALAVLFVIPFLFWGEAFQAAFTLEGASRWLERYGSWAWAAALTLLVLDLFLPVPATAVMAALGLVYGPLAGGLIGAAGSVLSGTLAYGLSRLLGRGAAERLAGRADLERAERLFRAVGGWIVASSRWLPLLPEVVACMAGLAGMPLGPFLLALACGAVPMAFTFATVGALGVDHPTLCVLLSALLPLALWPLARRVLTARVRRSNAS